MKLNSTFFISLISLFIIADIMNNTGYFKKALYTIVLAAEGSMTRLYLSIMAFTAFTVIVFNNISTVLIFIPVLYDVLRDMEFDNRLISAFIYSSILVCDIASVCFVNSNFINLIYSERFKIGFVEYLREMLPVGIIGILICIFFLYRCYKYNIGLKFNAVKIKNPDDMVLDWVMLNYEIGILTLMFICYFLFSYIGIDYSLSSFFSALMLMAIYFLRDNRNNVKINRNILKVILGSIIIFALVYIQDYIKFNVYFTANFENIKDYFLVPSAGLIQMALSWAFNNIPVSILSIFLINKINISPAVKEQIIFMSILFLDIGSTIFPFGSVSAVLAFKSLKTEDIKIKCSEYIKITVKSIVPVLASAVILFIIINL